MWRSEACKTFWLIHQHRCWEWPAGKSRLFYGSFVTSIITHIWYAFMKKVNKAEIDMLHRDTSYELGIQVMIANQFLSCFRRVWPDMLISCIEQNQSMKEHEIIELWTPVFGQVLTFKMYMQVFLKSAWKYKSTYWFLLCSTKRRCCSFSMSVKTGSKSTGREKIDSSRICCWRPVYRTVW